MRVWLKLLVSYLVLIGGMLLICVLGIRSAQGVRDHFHEVNQESVPLLLHLKDLRAAGLRIVSSTMEYSFLSSLGGAEPVALKREREGERQLLREGFSEYRRELSACGRYMLPVPQEKVLYARMEAAGTRLLAVGKNFILLRDLHAPAQRLIEAKEQFEAAERAFLDAVNTAIQFERSELDQQEESAFAVVGRAVTTTGSLAGFAFAVSLAVAGFISFSLSNRLSELRKGAQAVAAGRLDVTLPITSSDEIGELFAGFNSMVQALRTSKQQLASTNRYLQSVIATMPDALIVISAKGTVLDVNPAAQATLGYPREELLGRPFLRLFADRSVGREFILSVDRAGQVVETETVFLGSDGAELAVSLSASALYCGQEDGTFLCICHDITQRKNSAREIHQLAYFDALTGLPNRTLFLDRCNQALARAARCEPRELALLFFDLDHFKDLNDSVGHHAGDQLLQKVAERLGEMVRASDTLARFGGDEFVFLCTSLGDAEGAAIVARRVIECLERPFIIENREVFTSASIGIAIYPQDGTDTETLLKHADMAMYAAKEKGRNAFEFFSRQLKQKAQDRIFLEEGLRQALSQQELSLHYQPQVSLESGEVVGVEALARWFHAERGNIGPDRFIPVAEQSGLIRELGAWVLRTACLQCIKWHRLGHRITIGVNVSIIQLADPSFPTLVAKTLAEAGLDPAYLELELTESCLMGNTTDSAAVLKELKSLGVKIAIDDFGTGYSSLSYLKDFAVDRLKIDRSFVREITSRSDAAAIIKAIIAIGHSLGLRVIAEGIETAHEEEVLVRHRCDDAQGYFYAKPMPAAEVERFLTERSATAAIDTSGIVFPQL
ncbi:putative bifunctional diguanylate cyclase/phosphodiesterase [Geomesophilobacter sediminis]|uniref:EAL domain-containing protein n=1 Tax=Geomesophilobacter sediminis TaxID=2798584 RepID=A0A8J7LYV0_9BACT|nr:EAL domain-containing protein [Geomesophilobacter sediminis]MBJ6725497.1 EAL domain-containing protein [Geomesophilobacter sediminis]